MEQQADKDKIIISIAGPLIVPNENINIEFLKNLNIFIRERISKNNLSQFFLVVGGGAISKHYRDAGSRIIKHELLSDDLDWLGIHATKLNAHLVRTIFRDIAYPHVLKHYEIIQKVAEPVVVAAGWKPGWSTDFCKTLLCEDYKIRTIVNLSTVETLYDKDPRKFTNVHPVTHMSWKEIRKIVGNVWKPNMSVPFDPIASKKAQELGLRVVIVKGDNFENLRNYFEGKKFVGTIIEN